MAIGEIPVAVLFFAHVVIRNLSGERRVLTDECDESATCPAKGGFSRTSATNQRLCPVEGWFSRTSDSNDQLVRWKAGFHGQVTQNDNLSGERRVLTDEVAFPAPTYWR